MLRWIENTADAGLRFVGFADELARSIDHTGWYTGDDCMAGETIRGAVWRLPHSRGLIAGHVDKYTEGAALIELRLIDADDTVGAAYAADSIAEHAAEQERRYNRAWYAGSTYADLGEQVATMRRRCLALISEAKLNCMRLRDIPETKGALRTAIERLVEGIADARKERAELLANYGREDAFREHLPA